MDLPIGKNCSAPMGGFPIRPLPIPMETASTITTKFSIIPIRQNRVSTRWTLMETASIPILRTQPVAILRSLESPTVQPTYGSRITNRSIPIVVVLTIEPNTSTVPTLKTILPTTFCLMILTTMEFRMQLKTQQDRTGAIQIPTVEGCWMVQNARSNFGSSIALEHRSTSLIRPTTFHRTM